VNSYPCPPFDFPPCPNTLEALQQSIRSEAEAIQFYICLMEMAPDRFQKKIIAEIKSDEEKHLNNFQTAYCALTGTPYGLSDVTIDPPDNYTQGLMDAVEDELEAYEFYKTNFLCQSDNTVKCVFLDALMDESEHAQWFNNFLIRCLIEKKPHQDC
jgi:rubrerythrin